MKRHLGHGPSLVELELCSQSAYIFSLQLLTLMEVRANMTLVLPSMFVLRTRRMCWKLVGTTRDIVRCLASETTRLGHKMSV